MHSQRQRFAARHLNPGDRLAEFLCGLIMVLTFTLGAGLTIEDGPDAAFSLVLAAIGCNLAWGIIDGVLYVLTALSQRNQRVRFVRAVHDAADESAAQQLIHAAVEEHVSALASPAARAALSRDLLVHLRSDAGANVAVEQTRATRVTSDDLLGAAAIFWLELLACVPAIIPFLVLPHDHLLALRLSNGLLILTLFLVGQQWASYAGLNRWFIGFLMAGIGLALVAVAIALGG